MGFIKIKIVYSIKTYNVKGRKYLLGSIMFTLSNKCIVYTWAKAEIFISNNILKQVSAHSYPNRDLHGEVSGLY